MLKLDLARLEREGSLPIEADIPADDPLWEGSGLQFTGPLRVRLVGHEAGTGEVIVRGRLEGELQQECRRCLDPVLTPVEQGVTLVYAPVPEDSELVEETDERTLPPGTSELDLSDAVREELILVLDPYVVCDPECRGLCPVCGVDLNEETCDCSLEEPDPRWDALRALQNDQ